MHQTRKSNPKIGSDLHESGTGFLKKKNNNSHFNVTTGMVRDCHETACSRIPDRITCSGFQTRHVTNNGNLGNMRKDHRSSGIKRDSPQFSYKRTATWDSCIYCHRRGRNSHAKRNKQRSTTQKISFLHDAKLSSGVQLNAWWNGSPDHGGKLWNRALEIMFWHRFFQTTVWKIKTLPNIDHVTSSLNTKNSKWVKKWIFAVRVASVWSLLGQFSLFTKAWWKKNKLYNPQSDKQEVLFFQNEVIFWCLWPGRKKSVRLCDETVYCSRQARDGRAHCK